MINFILFATFIATGIYIKNKKPGWVNRHLIHKVAWYNLLAVVLCQFWANGINVNYVYLIGVGFFLHLFPMSLALLLKSSKSQWGNYLVAYSTFGGGNRGVLALVLISPTLLPQFFILDIGIFLSLLLVYPVVSRLYAYKSCTTRTKNPISLMTLAPIVLISCLIITGVYLHSTEISNNIVGIVFSYLKLSLLIVVSLYLGINLSFKTVSITEALVHIFIVRVFGVVLPALLLGYFLFPKEAMIVVFPLVLLASFLPVSSLAPQLTPDGSFREWVATQVIISSGLYVVILSLIAFINVAYA